MPDLNAKEAMEEIRAILKRRDLAGLVLVESPTHSEFLREFTPSWSCVRIEPREGNYVLRLRALREEYPSKEAHEKAVTESVSMIIGFLEMVEQERGNLQRMAMMLGQHFDISHIGTEEGWNESD